MSVIFNGTEVTDIIMDGVDLDAAIFNGEIVFGTWSKLISGSEFNEKIYKKLFNLSGSGSSNTMPTNLKRFSKGNGTAIPSDAIRVDTEESEYPVYIWANISNITSSNITRVTDLYWYSDADIVLFNADCSEMFAGVKTYNTDYRVFKYIESIDLTGFDSYFTTSMEKMFYKAEKLKSVTFSAVDTDKVTNMNQMFSGCLSLTDPGISGFFTSSLQTCNEAFNNCQALTNLDFTNFDFSNVTSMDYFCSSCYKIEEITGLNDKQYTKLTTMQHAFSGNNELKTINLSNSIFDSLIAINDAFYGDSKLTKIDLSKSKFKLLGRFSTAFNNCKLLEELDLSDGDFPELYDVSSSTANDWLADTPVTSLLNMENCNMPKLTNASVMFRFPQGTINLKNAKLPLVNSSSLFTSSRATAIDLTNCDLSSLDTGLSFNGCNNLESIIFTGIKCQTKNSFNSFFLNCHKLKNIVDFYDIPMTTLDNAGVRNMFNGCRLLPSVDVSGLDVSNAGDFYHTFYHCDALALIDLSSWKTKSSNISNTQGMFNSCGNLTRIYVGPDTELIPGNLPSGTTVSAASTGMFTDCTSLVGGNGTVYDSGYTDATYARVDTTETPGYFTEKTA